jgi:hypothetical protein
MVAFVRLVAHELESLASKEIKNVDEMQAEHNQRYGFHIWLLNGYYTSYFLARDWVIN